MFRLAHVTDPHFRSAQGTFAGARVSDFLNKRAVGAVNLVVNRRRHHKMELLRAMGDDLRREAPDHLALTGDLSNVSLGAEWQAALQWVEGLGSSPEAITIIPGNHDSYVPEVVERGAFEALFAAYQTADPGMGSGGAAPTTPSASAAARGRYPFVRFRGPLALVSVNSCVATGDLGAWGEIGTDQMQRLEAALTAPPVCAKLRVVLLHHPPVVHKGGDDRNLKDRRALAALLERTGADLVLHGHDHRDENATLSGPSGRGIPVIGAGSASYAGGPDRRARYNLYEFEADRITVVTRAHDEATGAFRETHRARL